jgi:hypothetical protein
MWSSTDTLSKGEGKTSIGPCVKSRSAQCRLRLHPRSYPIDVMVHMIIHINLTRVPCSHIFAYIIQCTLLCHGRRRRVLLSDRVGSRRCGSRVARFADYGRTELSAFIVAQSMALTPTSRENMNQTMRRGHPWEHTGRKPGVATGQLSSLR